ncbi:MAG: hypothetical protein QF830_07520 [Rhodospirillales bacterium]|jgi:hypothetical protein|nr:hypothetical protein [Rhodospirillales bacterium]MDP6883968.1 hypothetical protein [Rhodospirillales bacterium]
MKSNVTHFDQISEGFRAASGGDSLILAVLGVLCVTVVVWGVHYYQKRRGHSPFEQL